MDVTSLGPTELAKSLPKQSRTRLPVWIVLTSRYQHADPPQPFGLLRTRRERPYGGRTASNRDELAPPHSITSSAVASSEGGTVRPSAFAVLRLIANSNLVGA